MLTHLYIYKNDISLDKKAFFKYSTTHQELFLYKKSEMYEVAGDQYKRQFYSYFANTLKL